MTKFIGKGVYGAVAIGKISLFKRQKIKIEPVKIQDKEAELDRFEKAKQSALVQLEEIYQKALEATGEENAQIFEIHMMMMEDEDYHDAITDMICSQGVNAECAVSSASDSFAEMFSSMDDSYMRARAADIRDISNRILHCLNDSETEEFSADDKLIVCADDLAPSETVCLDKSKVLAFVTAHGSSNSHTAILARNMNIPAIIGVGEEFLEKIEDGQPAVANGFTGQLIVNP
ncbi:MAG: phosphoenolpyruvate-utilizing N-terminal domain-containing protein, partial [Anaerotignum sp.]